MEQFRKRAVFLKKLSGTKTFYGWNSGKCFGFAEAAVEVMLSGKDTEDIQAESELFYYHAVYPFLDSGSNRRRQQVSFTYFKGGRKNE